MSVPGIGRQMAERILEKCGSIEESLFEESLKGIKGLGPKIKHRLINVLTSEEPVHIERKIRR